MFCMDYLLAVWPIIPMVSVLRTFELSNLSVSFWLGIIFISTTFLEASNLLRFDFSCFGVFNFFGVYFLTAVALFSNYESFFET